MYPPLHPRLPGDYQTAAVQFERFEGGASKRGLANDEESISALSEVRAPALSARIKKRDNFTRLGVTGFSPVAFQGIAQSTCNALTGTWKERS